MKRLLLALALFVVNTLLLIVAVVVYLLGPIPEERATGFALIISPASVTVLFLSTLLLASFSYWLSGRFLRR